MPTGYTAKLAERGQRFKEFALCCARAFGALIEMRDDCLDAPIPEQFQPSSYYANALKVALKRKKELGAMTSRQRIAYGKRERKACIESASRGLKIYQKENARLAKMAERVKAWNPPSCDHVELKDFMLQQIGVSMHDTSYSEDAVRVAKGSSPMTFYACAAMKADRDINYYTEEQQKEISRVADRSAWVKKLRESLEGKVAT